MSRENELARLTGRFPHWEAWRGVSGLWYARSWGTTGEPVSGSRTADLPLTRLRRVTGPSTAVLLGMAVTMRRRPRPSPAQAAPLAALTVVGI